MSPSQISILVVEDDREIQDLLVQVLREEGYEVSASGDGLDALERLHGGLRPDVILLDLLMPPGMGGSEFIARLRREEGYSSIPVIVTSAASPKLVVFPRAEGYLEKPFHLDDLRRTVEKICAARTKVAAGS